MSVEADVVIEVTPWRLGTPVRSITCQEQHGIRGVSNLSKENLNQMSEFSWKLFIIKVLIHAFGARLITERIMAEPEESAIYRFLPSVKNFGTDICFFRYFANASLKWYDSDDINFL